MALRCWGENCEKRLRMQNFVADMSGCGVGGVLIANKARRAEAVWR